MSDSPQPIGFKPDDSPGPKKDYFWLLALGVVFVLVGMLVPPFLKPNAQKQLTICKSNCKKLATALEGYASDNAGNYPYALAGLCSPKKYLENIPTCPEAGEDTYSGTYRMQATPDSFSFQCSGLHHAKAYVGYTGNASNYPQYDAEQGLLDHP